MVETNHTPTPGKKETGTKPPYASLGYTPLMLTAASEGQTDSCLLPEILADALREAFGFPPIQRLILYPDPAKPSATKNRIALQTKLITI